MTGYEITLDRTFVDYQDDPYEVWVASVNADAYPDGHGETPGEALHALERHFDDHFGHEPRGNWNEDVDLSMVIGHEV